MKFIPFIYNGEHLNVLKRANINNVCVGSIFWNDPEFRDAISSTTWDTVLINRDVSGSNEPYDEFKYCVEIAECLTTKHTYIASSPTSITDGHIGENWESVFYLDTDSLTIEQMKTIAKAWRSSRVSYFLISKTPTGLVEYLNLGKYNTIMSSMPSTNLFDIIDLRNGGVNYLVSDIVTYDINSMQMSSLINDTDISPTDIRRLIEIRHICERGFNGG